MRRIKAIAAVALALSMAGSIIATPAVTDSAAAKKSTGEISLKKSQTTLTILQNLSKITRDSAKIRVKKAKGVKIKKTTYTVEDTDVAKVDKKGKVTAKSAGATQVTVQVKYKFKKKTKTKDLTYQVKVRNKYKNILTGVTMKYRTYATFVGGNEGINPCYDTNVEMAEDFDAWDCLKMTVKDPSIAKVGQDGYIEGKKAGTTTVTIASTDGTGYSVSAKLIIFPTRQDMTEKDDLYNSVRDEYLEKIQSGWDEEDKERFVGKSGTIYWSLSSQRDIRYKKEIRAIREDYEKRGKQTDYTPEDALASVLSTSKKLVDDKDGKEEEAFMKVIREKLIAPIKEAKTLDELIKVSEGFVANGLTGFVQGTGFLSGQDDDAAAVYNEVIHGKADPPKTPVDVCGTFYPKFDFPQYMGGHITESPEEEKEDQRRIRKELAMLGMEEEAEASLDAYYQMMVDISKQMWAEDAPEPEFLELPKAEEKFPHLRMAEHFRKKGYDLSDKDVVYCTGIGASQCLDSYMKEKNLGILKMYLAEAAAYPLTEYVRENYRIALPQDVDKDGKLTGDAEEQYRKGMSATEMLLPYDLDQIYTRKVYPKGFQEGFQALVEEFRQAYRKAIESSGYGSTIRANMLKKIDNLKVYSLFPDDETYKKFQIPYDLTTAEEGGNLADNLLKIRTYEADMERMTVGTKENSIAWWYPDERVFDSFLPKENNAFYNPLSNTAVFPHGSVGPEGLFTLNATGNAEVEVQNLAYLASLIGHEMGHAFDFQGTMFDEKGYLADLWGDDDKSGYQRKVDKLADIYGSLVMCTMTDRKTAYYQNGHKVVGEAMADLGGTETSLRILKEKYPGRDDLVQQFYRHTAEQWLDTKWEHLVEREVMMNRGDVHPAPRARANGVASMMDDFYRVFDVKEGDPMYVSPEDRVSLWEG
ncbi:MAG: Ig-like domain-containing protein [Eubacterium sp.]|nr:Ig-like domain-containing protein [Eubacterium sp.]